MNNLFAAIMTKTASSTLSTAVGGRIYHTAPENAEYPYVVFEIVSNRPEYPGGYTMDYYLMQFSIFSVSAGETEITGILSNLRTLFDDCSLTVTGSSLIYFIRGNFNEILEEITTPTGTASVKQYVQEYTLVTTK